MSIVATELDDYTSEYCRPPFNSGSNELTLRISSPSSAALRANIGSYSGAPGANSRSFRS